MEMMQSKIAHDEAIERIKSNASETLPNENLLSSSIPKVSNQVLSQYNIIMNRIDSIREKTNSLLKINFCKSQQ